MNIAIKNDAEFTNISENMRNIILTDNIDVDINMEILKNQGITENDIDTIFDEDNKTKKDQKKKDDILIREYISNPTRSNFNKLWERYYYGIKSYAHKFMHDWDLADDISVQTFARAWEFKDSYDITKARYSTWLYIICRNLCLGEINAKKKENTLPTDVSEMYDSTLLKNSGLQEPSSQYIIENNKLIENTADNITSKLYDTSLCEIEKLGKKYAEIMRLKFVENYKIREIADLLNMNESTVKNYIYKGKEIINKVIKKKYKNLYEMYLDCESKK
jgi:RNA polymerase sigma-70 factor (ECF subfamily)